MYEVICGPYDEVIESLGPYAPLSPNTVVVTARASRFVFYLWYLTLAWEFKPASVLLKITPSTSIDHSFTNIFLFNLITLIYNKLTSKLCSYWSSLFFSFKLCYYVSSLFLHFLCIMHVLTLGSSCKFV